MNETTNINSCERAGELVAYFYHEATRDERESFAAHLARCAACRDELAAFGQVREAVGHWRAEILHTAPALSSFADTIATTTTTTEVRPEQWRAEKVAAKVSGRAALAAFREFFTLSPMWLRAGMTAAALCLCALAALAVFNAEVRWNNDGLAFNMRLRSETKSAPPPQVEAPAGKVYTQAELAQLVAERDAARRELEDTRAQLEDSRAANLIAAVETLEPVSGTHSTPNNTRRERRTISPPNTRPQPQRRRSERDEEDVPRLYDLLIEAN
jgi:hypothetical protein